jgi:hypothetical protein
MMNANSTSSKQVVNLVSTQLMPNLNYRLDKLNTLRLKSAAAAFVVLDDIEQLSEITQLIEMYQNKFFVLQKLRSYLC